MQESVNTHLNPSIKLMAPLPLGTGSSWRCPRQSGGKSSRESSGHRSGRICPDVCSALWAICPGKRGEDKWKEQSLVPSCGPSQLTLWETPAATSCLGRGHSPERDCSSCSWLLQGPGSRPQGRADHLGTAFQPPALLLRPPSLPGSTWSTCKISRGIWQLASVHAT